MTVAVLLAAAIQIPTPTTVNDGVLGRPEVFALLTLANPEEEPARTVNDQVLGPASEFAVAGPARVCLMRTSFDLAAGETAYLDYLGIHLGGIRIRGQHGVFRIREGDSWAEPRQEGRIVSQRSNLEIVRYRTGARSRYLFYGASEYSDDGTSPVAWVEGPALNGSTRDTALLSRIDVNQADMASCNRRFVYGWNFILGEPNDGTEQTEQ